MNITTIAVKTAWAILIKTCLKDIPPAVVVPMLKIRYPIEPSIENQTIADELD